MAERQIFVCNSCGEEYSRWQGKCENCNSWNTLKEFRVTKSDKRNNEPASEIIEINKIALEDFNRVSTNLSEFDRVLGGFIKEKKSGGIVPGSIILLGGDPGIGKSTLLLQVASNLEKVIYVSGEESAQQIKMRFDRLGLKSKNLRIIAETDLGAILNTVNKEKIDLLIVDSIQTVHSPDFPSTPGSLVQVRECAMRLQNFAKSKHTSVILVGHVTKEGSVAGPKILEHLVDVVLYLEGEESKNTRILRGAKNRFGATDEIGIFEMTEKGLIGIDNPSKLFLEERLNNVPGSVVTATVEGTRALLIEIQALTTKTFYGFPQRRATGFDLNRLQLIIAVLQKRAGLDLSNQDIFINVVGGLKIKDTAVDLAVALAIVSSFLGKKISSGICAFGELGLSGEIRSITLEKKRITEGERIGFDKFIKSKNLQSAIKEAINV